MCTHGGVSLTSTLGRGMTTGALTLGLTLGLARTYGGILSSSAVRHAPDGAFLFTQDGVLSLRSRLRAA